MHAPKVSYYLPDENPPENPPDAHPGDLIFTRSDLWYSRFIRLAQAIDSGWEHNFYNHVEIITGFSGETIGARGDGLRPRHISDFSDSYHAIAHLNMSATDFARGKAFLGRVLIDAWAYDWAAIFGMGPYFLSGGRLMFASAGSAAICSALAAEFDVRARNTYFPKHSSMMLPSDLARFYEVADPK